MAFIKYYSDFKSISVRSYAVIAIALFVLVGCGHSNRHYLAKSKSQGYIVTLNGDTIYKSNRAVKVYKIVKSKQ